jgi:hypothetical protein
MRSLICLLSILLTSTASAVTIDFEGVVADDGSQFLNPDYTESGFIFSPPNDGKALIVGKDHWGNHDSANLSWCGVEGYDFGFFCLNNEVTLSHEDGAFSLHSFVGGGIHFEAGSEPTLIVEGRLVGGGILNEEVDISGGMQTITMGSDWTNLESVSFSAKVINFHCCSSSFDGSIDDIVVTAVPIPAAVWLFGSALAGLGWLGRKQTV